MDPKFLFLLLSLFAIIAFLYSSIGHGGASGYLALMAIFGFSQAEMKPTALTLNLFVSFISFFFFYKGKYFSRNIFLPIAIASIPMAFLGGMMLVNENGYKIILGILLLIPVCKILSTIQNRSTAVLRRNNLPLSILIGACIGFLSGLIGIGGGIILSPILLMLRWCNIKQAAGISALFIFVNSLSGLIGQITHGVQFTNEMSYLIIFASFGGVLGAYLGAKKMNLKVLRVILASVLFIASFKLIYTSL